MSDNDPIRRGDALKVLRWEYSRQDRADITALPAVDVAGVRAAALREAAAKAKEIADQYVGYMSRIEKAILALIDTPAADPMADPRVQALVEALDWYREQARLARLIHSEGDAGRHALQADGGKRAAAALAAFKGDQA
jgi:hypothetical protein